MSPAWREARNHYHCILISTCPACLRKSTALSVTHAEKEAWILSHLSLHINCHLRKCSFALIFQRDKMHCSWTVWVSLFTYIISQTAPDMRSMWLVNMITSLLLCCLESFSYYRHGTWSQWDITNMLCVSGIFMIYAARNYEKEKAELVCEYVCERKQAHCVSMRNHSYTLGASLSLRSE